MKASLQFFYVAFNPIDTNDILGIHRYLMKKIYIYKKMFGTFKKVFVVLLTSIVKASNHTRCVSLSNQKCIIQPTLINLHPNE